MTTGHEYPWHLTLQEHAERISREFGQEAAEAFLALATMRGIRLHEELETETFRSLLVGCDLPVHDFGLDPYPEDPT